MPPVTEMKIYHGSPDPKLMPVYGGGKEYHDYGQGFYCVENIEMAKEWACQRNDIDISYVYSYKLDMSQLTPLTDLSVQEPTYWLSALATHRYVSKEGALLRQRREKFIKTFPVSFNNVDVIKGWRANDQYFAYLRDFLRMDISYEAVIEAMKLGDLGEQIVLISEKAYTNCHLTERITIEKDEYVKYHKQYNKRDSIARSAMDRARDITGRSIEELISGGF